MTYKDPKVLLSDINLLNTGTSEKYLLKGIFQKNLNSSNKLCKPALT
jgi:hypothetical protein